MKEIKKALKSLKNGKGFEFTLKGYAGILTAYMKDGLYNLIDSIVGDLVIEDASIEDILDGLTDYANGSCALENQIKVKGVKRLDLYKMYVLGKYKSKSTEDKLVRYQNTKEETLNILKQVWGSNELRIEAGLIEWEIDNAYPNKQLMVKDKVKLLKEKLNNIDDDICTAIFKAEDNVIDIIEKQISTIKNADVAADLTKIKGIIKDWYKIDSPERTSRFKKELDFNKKIWDGYDVDPTIMVFVDDVNYAMSLFFQPTRFLEKAS